MSNSPTTVVIYFFSAVPPEASHESALGDNRYDNDDEQQLYPSESPCPGSVSSEDCEYGPPRTYKTIVDNVTIISEFHFYFTVAFMGKILKRTTVEGMCCYTCCA